jgi:hypothetical protein
MRFGNAIQLRILVPILCLEGLYEDFYVLTRWSLICMLDVVPPITQNRGEDLNRGGRSRMRIAAIDFILRHCIQPAYDRAFVQR